MSFKETRTGTGQRSLRTDAHSEWFRSCGKSGNQTVTGGKSVARKRKRTYGVSQ
jgi:hypothetical protein